LLKYQRKIIPDIGKEKGNRIKNVVKERHQMNIKLSLKDTAFLKWKEQFNTNFLKKLGADFERIFMKN